MPKKLELTGKIFHRLKVIKLSDKKDHGSSYWDCICLCGNKKIIRGLKLVNGSHKSCGCLKKELSTLRFKNGPPNKLKKSMAFIKRVEYKYFKAAQRRNLEFNLSLLEIETLIKNNCFYCNKIPKQTFEGKRSYNGQFLINGIDRVDNSKGYIINNCVSCCKICNTMKMALSEKDFIQHIKNIYENYIVVNNDIC